MNSSRGRGRAIRRSDGTKLAYDFLMPKGTGSVNNHTTPMKKASRLGTHSEDRTSELTFSHQTNSQKPATGHPSAPHQNASSTGFRQPPAASSGHPQSHASGVPKHQPNGLMQGHRRPVASHDPPHPMPRAQPPYISRQPVSEEARPDHVDNTVGQRGQYILPGSAPLSGAMPHYTAYPQPAPPVQSQAPAQYTAGPPAALYATYSPYYASVSYPHYMYSQRIYEPALELPTPSYSFKEPPAKPKSKAIAIIDPDTNEEIKYEQDHVKTRATEGQEDSGKVLGADSQAVLKDSESQKKFKGVPIDSLIRNERKQVSINISEVVKIEMEETGQSSTGDEGGINSEELELLRKKEEEEKKRETEQKKLKVEEIRRIEEEQKRKREEEENRLRQREEEEKILLAEEIKRKKEEEEERKRSEEEQQRLKDEELRRQKEERKRREEEQRSIKDEELKRQKEEEDKQREEEQRKKKEEEIKKQREEEQKLEEEVKKKAEENQQRQKREEEQKIKEEEKKKAEEEEQRQRREEERLMEEEKKKIAEKEQRRQKDEELEKQREEAQKLEEEEKVKREEEQNSLKEALKKLNGEERTTIEEAEKPKKEEEQKKLEDEKVNGQSEGEPKEIESEGKILSESDDRKEDEPTECSFSSADHTRNTPSPDQDSQVTRPSYLPGYWSPTNPTGMKLYTFEFIFAFKTLVKSKPAGLMDDPEISQQRGLVSSHSRMRRLEAPQFRQHYSHPAQSHGLLRGSMAGRGVRQARTDRQLPPLSNPQPVHTSGEDCWKPSVLPGKMTNLRNLSKEERKELSDQKIFKQLTITLNKLSYENYGRLSAEIKSMNINTREQITKLADLIFNKALEERPYCAMYARLCLDLHEHYEKYLKSLNKPYSMEDTFRGILLQRCQAEFESEKKGLIQTAYTVAAEDEDEKIVRAKYRMLGNIQFSGELVKLGMISTSVIYSCIEELLLFKKPEFQVPSLESIESLHHLLLTVGSTLDRKCPDRLDNYFARIKKLSESEQLPMRFRFMLQDVIELRANRWNKTGKPPASKPSGEISGGFAEERQKAAGLNDANLVSMSSWQQQTFRSNVNISKNEWNQVHRRTYMHDPNRKLVPGAGRMESRMYHGGQQQGMKPTLQPGNSFSALLLPTAAQSQPQLLRQPQKQRMPSGSSQRPPPHLRATVSDTTLNQPHFLPDILSDEAKLSLSPDEFALIDKTTQVIFAEYMELDDLQEAIESFDTEIKDSQNNYHAVVESLILRNVAKPKTAHRASDLIVKLMMHKKIRPEQFCRGFNSVLLTIEKDELAIDAPLVLVNMAEFATEAVLQPTTGLTFALFVDSLSREQPNQDSEQGQVLFHSLNHLSKKNKALAEEISKTVAIDWKLYIAPESTEDDFKQRMGFGS
ncbi:GRB10-interacting GYF protein 2-like [Zophobas morio]|uniref:GRB10-interacting GYF protein 2-like n=1 Tax=Zophobas morio TaxID=2755281 RepID=UPI003082B78F